MVNTVSRTGSHNVDIIVNPNDNPSDIITDQEEKYYVTVPGIEDLSEKLGELLKEIDEWDEIKDNLPINRGSLDILLLSNENLLMKLAPCEGRKPLYLTQDKCVGQLSYPCVFAGLNRDLQGDLTILKKSKSDIFRLVIFSIYSHPLSITVTTVRKYLYVQSFGILHSLYIT